VNTRAAHARGLEGVEGEGDDRRGGVMVMGTSEVFDDLDPIGSGRSALERKGYSAPKRSKVCECRPKAYGRMVFWEGASLWVLGTRPGEGPYPKTKFHAHHAVQVTLSLRGWFTLENRDRQVGGDAAAVAPDAEHAPRG